VKKKLQLLYNMIMHHPISVISFVMLWMLGSLINGLEKWHPRNPYLTLLDFVIQGHVKNIFYAEKIHDIYHLGRKFV
jgi:hypothetical protein